ncbi:A24 family peptidase [Hyphococcus flavus]|uniref:Prepilin leader peptidase/N-methyltransferase n=1 Tax=Hyphococcus flavus TaxID=1866326 RepID=A0AAF0CBL4_9PROT|nr:A24 family peptidase [Hyphococcus flavus]WDI31255.1 A24 family peptidase [Hyphococcus flavus]
MTDWVIFATCLLAGLLIGSFLNVVIHRGPAQWKLVDSSDRGTLVSPRSYCPDCKAPISSIHLIPLLGFAVLRGKCATCASRIPIRYPLVELMGGLAGIIAVAIFGFSTTALLAALFFWFLIALSFIDFETGYLPDALTIPLIILGLAANVIDLFTSFPNALIGAAVGYLVFRLIGAAFHRLRGLEGLGQGDAKLLAALGAWLGWLALAPIVFTAAILALGAVGALRLSGKKIAGDTPIPFGPALGAAGALAMVANGLDLPAYYWR